MRILHTSDWHLGVEYFQRSRKEEHQAFLDWLLETLEARDVDVLVVAGDVFDTTNPPAEAQQAYYRFLAELSRRSRAAVVVGGNHDSPSRLDAPREVLAALSAEVVGGHLAEREGPLMDPAGVLVPVRRKSEVLGVIAAVPYLHDWKLGVRGFDASAGEQLTSLHDAFRGVYSRLADKAAAAFPGVPLMATGHLTCLAKAGEKPSDEDAVPIEINRVGTLGAMGPQVFDPRFSYVALGHIHRGFAVDPDQRVWYSGTPIQVGSKEPADSRRVLLVDLDESGGTAAVEKLPVPVTRRLVTLSGPLDEVTAKLANMTWPDSELPPYIVVEALLDKVDLGARERLRTRAPQGPGGQAQLVEVQTRIQKAVTEARLVGAPTGEALTPESAFLYAWKARHEGAEVPDGVMQRFRSLLEAGG
jgi:exonuclease SbcD